MLLAIDTSSSETSVAIYKSSVSEGSLEICLSQSGDSHSSSLSVLVDKLIVEAGITINDLSAVVLGHGPGSFTGLRIGFAFAKGLALARSLPIYSFSSLAAQAWQQRHANAEVIVIEDARREQYFAGIYKLSHDRLNIEIKEDIFTIEDIKKWFCDKPKAICVTSNPELKYLFETESSKKLILSKNLASSLAELVSNPIILEAFNCKPAFGALAIAEIKPYYLRRVAALTIEERNLAKRL